MPPEPAIALRPLAPRDAPACDAIVASLPYHFGDEHGRELCAAAVRRQDGLVATVSDVPIGFITWRAWYAAAAEITWMAVHAGERRRGVGRRLVGELVDALPAATRFLVVTTLSQATPDDPGIEDGYAGTRRFWNRCGFEPVWDPAGWWNDDNQAVVMIRALNG